MIGYSDDARLDDLLAPLRRLEPVELRERQARRWRPVVAVAVAVFALAGTGVAIADGLGAFNGIGAAQHPQSPADVSPQIPAWLQESCADEPFYTDLCHLVPDSSRLVGQLPGGDKLWVVASTRGNLCVVVESDGAGCGSALSSSQPTTAIVENRTMSEMLAYGVALDGVTSVSFTVRGEEVTVPVKDNVWAYEQASSAYEIQDLVAHFADGRTVALP
jgi:hypothetical protein